MLFFLCDVQTVMSQILSMLLLQLEWWIQGVQIEDLGAANPYPMVWSATAEPLQCLRQSTSMMIILI